MLIDIEFVEIEYSFLKCLLYFSGGDDKLKQLLGNQKRHKMHGLGVSGTSAITSAANTRRHSYTKREDDVSVANKICYLFQYTIYFKMHVV